MKKIILILLVVLSLAGCAISTRYMSYTKQRSPAKPKDYSITVYPASQRPPASQLYRVIGKVEVQGYASDRVSLDTLTQEAKNIAREQGADAIINADRLTKSYNGPFVVPGYYGDYHEPVVYARNGDTFLKFTGELIIFTSASTKN
jgi:hypothetical protein